MHNLLKAIIFLFFLLLYSTVKSQVTAGFYVNGDTVGCGHLVGVQFINTSTGSGTLTYNWDLGNGNSSVLQDPVADYPSPGTYNITLVATNGTNYDTAYFTITVYNEPVSDFNFNPAGGCVPITIDFTDNSAEGDAPVNSWYWTFGDGNTANGQTVSHEYQAAGNWDVTLLITDTNSCQSLISHTINATEPPVIDINADITNFCTVPVDITFGNNVSCTGCTYEWDFGDGGTSTLQNPVHTYTSLGTFDVSLTITDQYGCVGTDTFPDFIELNQVTASMTVPDTICKGVLTEFINTSGIECIWDFGDGLVLPSSNPSVYHSYSSSGTYNVTLIAGVTPCFDTIVQTVYVEEATASFTANPQSACQAPAIITYDASNSSSNVVSWEWHFGDGTISTVSSPVTTNTYTSQGVYNDTLIVYTAAGCKDVFIIPADITVQFPYASINTDHDNGCAPLVVNFTDNSTSNQPIVSWEWTFPGGTPASSTNQNPSNITFNNEGEYQVLLVITNDEGCVDSVYYTIEVGVPVTPDFYIPDTIKCASDTISFVNLTDTTNVDSWNWQFSTEFEPTDNYIILDNVCSDTGFCEIMLITEYNGCRDTLIIDSTLYINGPIVHSIVPSFDCDSPYVFTFNANIVDAEYWDWDFTDGTTLDSVTTNPVVHTFAATGTDTVLITAYNDLTGCTYDTNVVFLIADVQAIMNYDTIACVGNQFFNGYPSIDADTYDWDFGDGSPLGHNYIVQHNYTSSGLYDIMLIVYDATPNHCPDTAFGQIYVTNIHAGFVADTLYGCTPFEVSFIDTSISDFGYFINYSFGDGNYSGTVAAGDTVLHTYQNTGTYNIVFTITDTIGCTDMINVPALISTYDVTADFYVSDSSLCAGIPVQFVADSNDVYNYYWDFDNGITFADTAYSTTQTVYADTGYYSPQLIVEYDTLGCRDTLKIDSLLYVQDINVDISLTQNFFDCYFGTEINNGFLQNNTSTTYSPLWYWDFGNGNSSTIQNPVFQYSMPGDYWIHLTATTPAPYGCSDIDSVMITLMGPYADIYLANDTFCIGDEIVFSLMDSINIHNVYWGFGDGNSSNDYTATHAYDIVGEISFVLDVSESGCPVDPVWDTLYIIEVFSEFEIYDFETDLIDSAHCSPFTVDLENTSNGASSWTWDFGDGQTSSGYNPANHIYTNTGTTDLIYSIQLSVEDTLYGCKDTAIHDIMVYASPQITITDNMFICRGNEVSLYVTGGAFIEWSPDSLFTNPFTYNPLLTPDSTNTYYATITDANTCTNTDSVTVTVQQEPNITYSPDTSIIIGEIVDLFVEGDQANLSYEWIAESNTVCANCTEFSDIPLQTTEYTIIYEDSAGCFSPSVDILVTVIEEYSLDVPQAFTPNGDNVNDVVFVRGWGIKKLLEFNIYNRWGQKIFTTDDINKGWDGTYNGKKQNMDTYAYYVKVLLWNNTTKDKKGTVNLIR